MFGVATCAHIIRQVLVTNVEFDVVIAPVSLSRLCENA